MAAELQVERREGLVTLTLAHPGKLNAVDLALWVALEAQFRALDADDTVRCIIVRGAGGTFVAGGDIEEFLSERHTHEHAWRYHNHVGAALAAIGDCRHPTLALIEGACIGGGLEIAGQCDLRICGESARFGAPINRLGFSMYPGEMAGLLRLVGAATLREILLEGRIFDAPEALQKGLVHRVVPDPTVADEAHATARRIMAGAPLVARWHKQWIRRLEEGTPLSESELRGAFAFLDTEDYREGLAAFLQKRKPEFRGR